MKSEEQLRKETLEKLKDYSGNENQYGGIALQIEDVIFTVSFGDGSNLLPEDEEKGCDDYLYILAYANDDEVAEKIKSGEYNESDWQDELEELDGFQMIFNTEEKQYGYDICNAVYDALNCMFIFEDTPEFKVLSLYTH